MTIPTNRPVVRKDNEDRVYRTEAEKWEAIMEEIKESSGRGQAGAGWHDQRRKERAALARCSTHKYGIEHEVLNAKHHEREAQIVRWPVNNTRTGTVKWSAT